MSNVDAVSSAAFSAWERVDQVTRGNVIVFGEARIDLEFDGPVGDLVTVFDLRAAKQTSWNSAEDVANPAWHAREALCQARAQS